MSDDLTHAYLDAIEAERQAWTALGKRLPGQPGFSPSQWNAWVEAVAELKLEAERWMAGAQTASPASTERINA
jgi:hypothetical protein